ncbi:hypothetical protein PV08_08630 [Exophiala spinifera]|uniref:Uncharacterized protein n=1 Tax=Exophiala spinifera TaxID=91928 RepID=A0A0D1ZKU1_9EURO|nr:uncharacterized protein PV08_08630 [Exophiala spinifera]KIW13442.1 hypothetical protein PV08_08630 [Exophiala spinifera]
MKLINTKTFALEDFFAETAPPYAILSHTWTSEELTYQDITCDGGLSRNTKKGYAKLTQTCRLASQDGLEYAWIDTCCIDKSSSAELSESINSMYAWYGNSTTCYVYLEDLHPCDITSGTATDYGPGRDVEGDSDSDSDSDSHSNIHHAANSLQFCRWFRRGWTLQELLAPAQLTFYDSSWTLIGTRDTFSGVISRITSIPRSVLSQTFPVSECSIAIRMSWAAHRTTTRTEDIAYCLLGLFDVNMPLLYGEGMKAFRRLQEEIVRRSNDFTIFAWEKPASLLALRYSGATFTHGPEGLIDRSTTTGLSIFAPRPSCFANTTIIDWLSKEEVSFSVTNAGLLFSGTVDVRVLNSAHYILLVGLQTTSWRSRLATGIYLRKQTPTIYHRDPSVPLAQLSPLECASLPTVSIRNLVVSTAPKQIDSPTFHAFRQSTVHVSRNPTSPKSPGHRFRLVTAIPETLWSYNEHIFLKPEIYSSENGRESAMYPMVLGVRVLWWPRAIDSIKINESDDDEIDAEDHEDDRDSISLCILCDYRTTPPRCKIFLYGAQGALGPMLFDGRHKSDSVDWADVELQVPSIHDLSDEVDIPLDNDQFTTVSASLPPDRVTISGEEVHVYSLRLEAKSRHEKSV